MNTRIKENKKLLEKYPFLVAFDWYGNPVDTYKVTALDEVEDGWKLLFLCMCEKINEIGYPKSFGFVQIKEKYGQLRMYTMHSTKEINELIDIYSLISENVCMKCGKPNVPMLQINWIYPSCRKCFENTLLYKRENVKYDDIIDNDTMIKREMKYTRFYKDKFETITKDITEYVVEYIEKWHGLNNLNN